MTKHIKCLIPQDLPIIKIVLESSLVMDIATCGARKGDGIVELAKMMKTIWLHLADEYKESCVDDRL